MPGFSINRITNGNVYLGNNSMLGKVAEVTLPEVNAIMTEHKALGMFGKVELPAGLEKLEGTIIWNAFYKDVAIAMGNPFQSHALQIRCNVETYDAQGRMKEVPMVTFLTVMFKKNPLGAYKQAENAEFTSLFSATYVKQVIDGDEVLELDYMANIFRVNGADVMSTFRNSLGV